MTAAGALFDLSGQTQQYMDRVNNPSLPSGTKSGTASGTTTESSTSTSSKAVNTQNTPQFALNALQELIAQLQDRPVVSEEEAVSKAPPLRYGYNAYGWGLNDPLTGRTFAANDPTAIQLQAKRAAERQRIIREGGVIEGGTAETKRATAERQTEIQRNRATQAGYTKDAAFADADALTARFTRQMLEQLMPTINRAVEGSGTSGGAVQGLLAQDAAARTAEAQAALGLQAAVSYGQVNNQLAATLELLTRMDQSNPTTQLLLQAINQAKGTINAGVESVVTNTVGTKVTDSISNEVQVGTKNPLSTPTPQAAAPAAPVASGITQGGPSYMSIEKTGGNSEDNLLSLLQDLTAKRDPITSGYTL